MKGARCIKGINFDQELSFLIDAFFSVFLVARREENIHLTKSVYLSTDVIFCVKLCQKLEKCGYKRVNMKLKKYNFNLWI